MSWPVAAVGDVCDVVGGGTPSKNRADFYGGSIPWASIRDMRGDWIETTEFGITDEAVAFSATNVIPAGNVIIATRVGLGKVARLRRDTAINQDIRAVIPRDDTKLDKQFLFHWFKSISHIIEAEGKGATVKGVTLPFVKSLQLPLPSMSEQRRIVALLDEAFAGIANAKANAEKSLRNAREVSDSIAQQVLDSAGGDEFPLESVAADDCSLSYGIVQPGNDVEDGLPVVRPVDLTRDVITLDGLKRIDPQLALGYQRTRLQGGELLLCVRGTTGTVSVAAPELEGANVTRGIVPIRFKPERVTSPFGYHLMKSAAVQSQIREKTYGTALMQINIGDLRNIKVKIPPLSQQNEIAKRLDTLREEAAHIQSLYTRKLAALDQLKQSLLHQAFSGQL